MNYHIKLISKITKQQLINRKDNMGIWSTIKDGLRVADFFYSSQMFRYNNKTQYKTITGGIVSLIIIIATFAAFWGKIVVLFEMSQITSTFEVSKQSDPSLLHLTAGQNNFMVGVYLKNFVDTNAFDLNSGPQLFDISLKRIIANYGSFFPDQVQQLVPCTFQHYNIGKQTYTNIFQAQIGHYGKCLKLGSSYNIGGVLSSKEFSYIRFQVRECQNTTQNGNHCAPPEVVEQAFQTYKQFSFQVAFFNPVINPNKKNHIDYYLNTQNFYMFSKNLSQTASITLSDYTIRTDTTIMPFETYKQEKGFVNENQKSTNFFLKTDIGQPYINVQFMKSENSLKYNRQFLKISTVISYMGGLIGAVIAVLFFLKIYTDNALELNISIDLFFEAQRANQGTEPQDKPSFNIFSLIGIYIYKFMRKFKKGDSFTKSKTLYQYKKQINKQLDVKLLLRRLLNMEQFISRTLKEDEIEAIKKAKTFQRAKYLRKLLNQEEKLSDNTQEGDDNQRDTKNNGEQIPTSSDLNHGNQNLEQGGLDIILNPDISDQLQHEKIINGEKKINNKNKQQKYKHEDNPGKNQLFTKI